MAAVKTRDASLGEKIEAGLSMGSTPWSGPGTQELVTLSAYLLG